jgi:hypothetical protein
MVRTPGGPALFPQSIEGGIADDVDALGADASSRQPVGELAGRSTARIRRATPDHRKSSRASSTMR